MIRQLYPIVWPQRLRGLFDTVRCVRYSNTAVMKTKSKISKYSEENKAESPRYLVATKKGLCLRVSVTPNAKSTGIRCTPEAVHIALNSPAKEGKANAELIGTLSSLLCVPKSALSVVRGEKGRDKLVLIDKASTERVSSTLSRLQ